MSENYDRVLLLGSGGSGKSTLARTLGARLELPVIHLDREFWLPDWVEPSKDVWLRRIVELAAEPRWVMDGNYGSSLGPRVARADLIVLLDLPPWRTIPRVIKRRLLFRYHGRSDMAPGCPEKLDLVFLKWIWDFRKNSLPRVFASIDAADARASLVRLRTPREVTRWLESL